MERGMFTRIKMYVKIENKTQIRLNSAGGKCYRNIKISDVS